MGRKRSQLLSYRWWRKLGPPQLRHIPLAMRGVKAGCKEGGTRATVGFVKGRPNLPFINLYWFLKLDCRIGGTPRID